MSKRRHVLLAARRGFQLKCSNVLNTQIPSAGYLDFFKLPGFSMLKMHESFNASCIGI